MADGLSEELLGVPGVAGADVERVGEQPTGVRVRLDPGVDAAVVARRATSRGSPMRTAMEAW